jgi:flagellar hook protein FlgE
MSFQQGLSGLNASSKALDTIGNNIANSGTVGFKLANTQFADVFAASLSGAGSSPIGLGTKVATVAQQFTQGNISVTSNPLDMAINGGGFYRLQNATGDILFSRNGQFQLDKDGYIVNAGGQQLTGYAADVDGNINPPLVPLRLFDPSSSSDAAPQATGTSTAGSGIQANLNLDSREAAIPAATTFNYANASTYNKSTAVTTYDSLGNPHVYTLYFVKSATVTNRWAVYATVSNPAGAAPTFTDLSGGGATPLTTLNFNTDGSIVAAGSTPTQGITAAQLGYAGGVDPLSFPVNFTGATQFGSTFTVNSLTQDGFASGKLAGFSVGDDGVILGKYTNGQSKNLGQVILAAFRNPQGLQPLGNNVWAATSTSGAEMDGAPGSSGQYGPIQSSALEDSNVDLTAELVNMITQQRVYQANAQTIKTQDSILQTLVNLR